MQLWVKVSTKEQILYEIKSAINLPLASVVQNQGLRV